MRGFCDKIHRFLSLRKNKQNCKRQSISQISRNTISHRPKFFLTSDDQTKLGQIAFFVIRFGVLNTISEMLFVFLYKYKYSEQHS